MTVKMLQTVDKNLFLRDFCRLDSASRSSMPTSAGCESSSSPETIGGRSARSDLFAACMDANDLEEDLAVGDKQPAEPRPGDRKPRGPSRGFVRAAASCSSCASATASASCSSSSMSAPDLATCGVGAIAHQQGLLWHSSRMPSLLCKTYPRRLSGSLLNGPHPDC